MTLIVLPFPPASLSGHAKGHWRAKAAVTKQHREWARLITLAAGPLGVPDSGDIPIRVRFIPPSNRGDRTNFPNRLKASLDGIAMALGVNDSRFLPSYEFCPPSPKAARVEVIV